MKSYSNAVVMLCGGLPSKELYWRTIARLELAVNRFLKEKNCCLLISSGVSGHANENYYPESHIYYKYLRCVYPRLNYDDVYIEDISRDTIGNVYFSLFMLQSLLNESSTITWVTNSFHLKRLKLIVSSDQRSNRYANTYIGAKDRCSGLDCIKIKKSEENSLNLFMENVRSGLTIQNIIFFKHDFYNKMNIERCDI